MATSKEKMGGARIGDIDPAAGLEQFQEFRRLTEKNGETRNLRDRLIRERETAVDELSTYGRTRLARFAAAGAALLAAPNMLEHLQREPARERVAEFDKQIATLDAALVQNTAEMSRARHIYGAKIAAAFAPQHAANVKSLAQFMAAAGIAAAKERADRQQFADGDIPILAGIRPMPWPLGCLGNDADDDHSAVATYLTECVEFNFIAESDLLKWGVPERLVKAIVARAMPAPPQSLSARVVQKVGQLVGAASGDGEWA